MKFDKLLFISLYTISNIIYVIISQHTQGHLKNFILDITEKNLTALDSSWPFNLQKFERKNKFDTFK